MTPHPPPHEPARLPALPGPTPRTPSPQPGLTPQASPTPEFEPPPSPGEVGPHPRLVRHLTASVWILRAQTRRRVFPTAAKVLLLGPDGAPVGDPSPDLLAAAASEPDHALRVDLALAGLDRLLAVVGTGSRPTGSGLTDDRTGQWLATLLVVRPDPLECVDGDLAWWRAWLVACGIAGVRPAPVYVATRTGWLDVPAAARPIVVPRLRPPQPRRRQPRGDARDDGAAK
jgi:hypothetical protein